ncbi:MAG: flagellar basal body rod protein FlgB [Calditrichaeota bacterium]|nr:flagellar basal body rod protein FlgB [Calditrichota bacterium]
MLKELLFDATHIPILGRGLDAYALRQRAIASNITNAETPGYERRIVKFEDQLREALGQKALAGSGDRRGSSGMRPDAVEPKIDYDPKPSDINDLNNVDIDAEMAALAENHMQFNMAVRLLKHNFEMLNLSIRGQ